MTVKTVDAIRSHVLNYRFALENGFKHPRRDTTVEKTRFVFDNAVTTVETDEGLKENYTIDKKMPAHIAPNRFH